MESMYQHAGPRPEQELIELSDSEDMYSANEEEMVQANLNNRRLAQALNYLSAEGGEDSPPTFISRVNRIHDALLQRLPHETRAFDTKLYRRVRAMVLDIQREFDNAARQATPQLESDEDLPEYYTPSATEEVLYRTEEPSPSPTPVPTRPASYSKTLGPKHHGDDDSAQRERVFRYGGPGNEPERWCKDYPGILPFPETHLMARWESLKIDYNLSRSKDDKNVETNVPLGHEQLKPYFDLPQYESGSRFKLPVVSKEVQNFVQKCVGSLGDVVIAFNNKGRTEGIGKDYSPRAFLEQFEVGDQASPKIVSPTQLRRALAITPTKPQVLSDGSTGTIPSKRDSPAFIEDCLYEANNLSGIRTVTGSSPLAQRSSSLKPHTSSNSVRAGSAIRAFDKKVRRSSGAQAAVELATSTKKPSPIRTLSHVEIPKRGRGRPRKSSLVPVASPTPITPIESSLGKRKPSAGSQPYSPPKSSIKKVLRDAKGQKSTQWKNVGFVEAPIALEEDNDDPTYPASPIHAIKPPVRATTAGLSKAAATGKQAGNRRTPLKVREERVSPEEYEQRMGKVKGIAKAADRVTRGTTRSGRKFAV
ncbi:hypothetical protein EK21DRAFT_111092 [Setomelanomma holmii]|uniref:Uncharacterized protein n=1 Tax=Setomelanomma holmii TaxID=210430 RepID=A0A9P4HDD3_9PLEO|nr:hypothetical protein EK21DRAFT_111092 [Setomelanomma holmii]